MPKVAKAGSSSKPSANKKEPSLKPKKPSKLLSLSKYPLKSALKKPTTQSSSQPSQKVDEQPDMNDEEHDALHLKGFSEDEEDNSSDEEGVAKHAPIDVGTLPTVAKDDETVRKRLEDAHKRPTEDTGVIHVGHIPHGFYEDQMRGYFSQFGEITRLRLSRNKKTGRPKHYAFIEFDSSAVAEIVADTMDNYLLHGHILKCKVVPKDQVHPNFWIGANRKFKRIPHDRIARIAHNKERTEAQQKTAEARLLKRQKTRAAKLEKLGIKYDLSITGYQPNPVTAS